MSTEVQQLKEQNAQLKIEQQRKDAALTQQRAILEQKDVLLAEQSATIRGQEAKYEALQQKYNDLIQQAFGRRSERYLGDPRQMALDFGDTAEAQDAADGLQQAVDENSPVTETTTTRRKRKKKHNDRLPEDLPRIEVLVDVPDADKTCNTHGVKTLIGYDTQETLVYTPATLEVRVAKFPKYACPNQPGCGVIQPDRPPSLIEGNRYDTSVAAEIITAKYGFHLPLYRQQDLFAGSGWTPCRSTLLNILTAAAVLIRPLVEYFADEVRRDPVIGTDDTGVTLLLPRCLPTVDPNSVRSQRQSEVLSKAIAEDEKHVKAKMWAYRAATIPLNVFDFTVSRHRDGPDQFLIDNNYDGILLGDCYTGYTGISLRGNCAITHAACNAHARRKIFEARDNHPQIASVLLAFYQQLYDVEDQARGANAEGRLELRQTKAVPVWQQMREYLGSDAMKPLLAKEKMTAAINYVNNHWEALQVYVSNANVRIDNNECEQLMKQVAVGRKNWLFHGSIAAGERAADLMTLVSSALRNDLHVWAYVKGVLDALLAGSTDYESLRPDNWAQSHPEHIRTYRVKERRDKADRKQRERAKRRAENS